ncbi:B12-binding domain-containing protein, partial [Bacteroides xylanisolvens]
MKTWKSNLEETKQRYINWWNHKGIILNMWEHFQEGVQPHAEIMPPAPAKDLSQKWFDPQWRAEYLDWYVAHSSLKADILPVANTQLGPGSLAAILGGVFEGGEDTIWIHPNPDFTDEIVFNLEHPNWILHKELLKACKAKANGHYFVGMPDLMEGLDVLAALKGTDRVLLDTVMQPEILEQQMQQINDIYFKVFDELYDIIREGDEMAFCYFSSWAPGKMSKLQSDISTMISQDDYRRFVQPFIREQCQKIDYTLYHLDGVGAMHHLPALLEIEELNAIQWTPGVGEPQGGSPKWYDLYKKILAGGKSVMACWVTLDELKPLLDHIGADGVHLEMDFHNEKEVEQAMRIVEEYTGSSTAVNTNEHQQDADLATTGQERICIREEQHQQEDKLKPLYEAIVAGKLEPAVEITRQAIAEGIAPPMIINNYMIKAMGEVG